MPDKKAPAKKPTMWDNYKTLGAGMKNGAKEMVKQKKFIVDEKPKPKKK